VKKYTFIPKAIGLEKVCKYIGWDSYRGASLGARARLRASQLALGLALCEGLAQMLTLAPGLALSPGPALSPGLAP
jgi:hypothetical protein